MHIIAHTYTYYIHTSYGCTYIFSTKLQKLLSSTRISGLAVGGSSWGKYPIVVFYPFCAMTPNT